MCPMANPRVGFIGLGLMGHGMAKNLAAKGFPLAVKVNRDRSRLADIVALGAREAHTPADAARDADVVILCVNGSPQVEEVVFGADGLLGVARPGLFVVDTSTSEPGSTRRVREVLAPRGTAFIDAPLARTPIEAEQGRLNAMVGAETMRPSRTIARIRPIFCSVTRPNF